MKAIQSTIARIDLALDYFWVGMVLRSYHRMQAQRFSRKAARLARIGTTQPAYAVISHQAARHKLEAELITP